MIGAAGGIALAYITETWAKNLPKPGFAVLCPGKDYSYKNTKLGFPFYSCDPKDINTAIHVGVAEIFGAALFVIVVMAVKYNKTQNDSNLFNAIVIGGTFAGTIKLI